MPPTEDVRTPHPPPRRSRFVSYIVVGLLVLGMLVYFFTPVNTMVRQWLSSFLAPEVLQDTTYIGLEGGRTVLYRITRFGVTTRSFGTYALIDYLEVGEKQIALLQDQSGHMDVYDVSSDTPIALTTDGKEKMALAIRSDAQSVAYGVKERNLPLNNPDPAHTIYNLPDWDVMLFTFGEAAPVRVGPGNHPQFYNDGLFYPAPAGFVWRTPGDNGFDEDDEGSILMDTTAYRIMRIPVFTDTGTFAFPSMLVPQYDLLTIADTNPLRLESGGTPIEVSPGTRDLFYKENAYYTLTESHDGLVSIDRLKEGGETVSVFVFPPGVSPYRVTNVITN